MKTKTKIMAFVALASLTMVLLMVGVWALKTVNFTVGGNLSYIAPGIEATISKGTMSNGVWVNASDASTKMPLTQITRTDTEESLEEKFSYWQNLNLNFNEAGDDVTIIFSITNDMAEKYLSINVTTSYASADNATISINTSSVTLDPDASQSFTITLAVTDKTANATLSAFAIVFHMEMTDEPEEEEVYEEDVVVDATDYPNLTFTPIDDSSCSVADNGSSGEVVIPSYVTIDGTVYTVTEFAEGDMFEPGIDGTFLGNKNLTSITVPGTISTITDNEFYSCSNLERVIIEEGVTTIGTGAFMGCRSIVSVSMPRTILLIGSSAFATSSSLEYNEKDNGKYLGNEDNQYVILMSVVDTSVTSFVVAEGCSVLGPSCFSGCSLVTSISVPESLSSLCDSALVGLSSMTFPVYGGCEYLGTNQNPYMMLIDVLDTSLSTYEIHSSCTKIASFAFSGCTGLTSITIPDSVTSIGSSAFSDCTGLTTITIPDSVTSIGTSAFLGCTGLESVAIGSGVTSIGSSAFRGCIGLTAISLGNGLKDIQEAAFFGCTSLTSITIPDKVSRLGANSFSDCENLQDVILDTGLKLIGISAFSGCTGLTSITIPDSVTSIGMGAFMGCTNLTYNTYGNGKYLGNSTNPYVVLVSASSTDITSCTINSGCKVIYKNALSGCASLTKVEVKATTPPTGGYVMFADCPLTTGIFVPSASVDLYKSAEYWSDYSSKIQAGNF